MVREHAFAHAQSSSYQSLPLWVYSRGESHRRERIHHFVTPAPLTQKRCDRNVTGRSLPSATIMASWSRLPSANGIPRSLDEKTKLPSRVFQALLFLSALAATFVYSTWALQQRSVSYFDQGRAGHSLKPKHGLLVLGNATGLRHPISILIARGERLWQEKLDQQSTTLEEAYHEYRRRYSTPDT